MKAQKSKIKTQKFNSKLKKAKAFAFLLAILTFSFCLFTYFPLQANAEAVSLGISPSTLQIKAQGPTTITAPLTIENFGDEPIELKTEFRQFKASDRANGQIEYLAEANQSGIFNNIDLTDGQNNIDRLSLAPKQKRNLQLIIDLNTDEAAADYYFSLLFIQTQDSAQPANSPNGQQSISRINTGVAMNVLLSVGMRKESSRLEIQEFSTPGLVKKGPIPFSVKLRNNTSEYLTPKASIRIKNMFGQLIGKVDIPKANILADSSRYLTSSPYKPNPDPYTSPPGEASLNPVVIWPESFLLGFYTAEISVETDPNLPPQTQTLRFTAIPIQVLLSITFMIILVAVTYKRVKSKISV